MPHRWKTTDLAGRKLKDYCVETNRMRGGRSIARAVELLNRRLGCTAARVLHGHKTLINVQGVPLKVLVLQLTQLLDGHGSAFITRRKGVAGNWLLRPLANRPLVRI